MKRYDSYKDSGVEWIGEIPSHWEVLMLKRCASIKTGCTPPTNELKYYENEDINWFTPSDIGKEFVCEAEKKISEISRKDGVCRIFPAHSIYFVGIGSIGKVSYCDIEASANQQINVITPNKRADYRFLTYCLKSQVDEILLTANKVTLPIINQERTGSLNITFPPILEQKAIATYLDKKCGEIDKAIATQQKRIELLQELRQNIITHAVTRGINPDVPLKDSGVEWIGQVPEHWEVRYLKTLIKEPLQYGANESAEDRNDDNPRYIRITDISEKGLLKEDTWKSLDSSKAQDYILKKGDVLFARSGATVGKTYIFNENYPACYAGYLIKARCKDCLMSQYLMFYTQSGLYVNWKNSIFIQSTIQNIGADKYSYLPIVLPPLSEQQDIVSYIEKQTARLDSSISKAERQISLLQELKQSIITEVVTGKRKVC